MISFRASLASLEGGIRKTNLDLVPTNYSLLTKNSCLRSVMYFGDHPYADLADVTLHHGWHTGAVIRELEVGCKYLICTLQNRTCLCHSAL